MLDGRPMTGRVPASSLALGSVNAPMYGGVAGCGIDGMYCYIAGHLH